MGSRRILVSSRYGAGWTDIAKGMAAMFRATRDVWAGDPALKLVIYTPVQGGG